MRARQRLLTAVLLVSAGLPVRAFAPGLPEVAFEGRARADATDGVTLTEVGAIVRRGDDEGALAALERLDDGVRRTPRARYLEARLAERTGRLARAERAYDAAIAEGLPSFVEGDARTRHARLLARIGRCADAMPRLVAVGTGRARAVAGECALALGRLDEAIALLEAIDREAPGPVDHVAVRLALAEAIARRGDRPRAITLLRSTWLDRPTHRARPALEAALRALDPASLVLTDAERELEVATLERDGAFARARRALDALPAPATDEAHVARLRRGAALAMRARAYAEAAEAYATTFARSRDDADAFERARALVRDGEHARALPLLDGLGRDPDHARDTLGDDARALAADVALALGEPDRASAYVAASGRTPRTDALRLGLALHGLATGDLGLAERHVDAAARVDDPFKAQRARYLRARVSEAKRDIATATSTYRALATEDPFGYYGLVAASRLRALGVDVPALPALVAAEPDPAASPTLPEEVAFYATLGLVDEAREALRRAEASLRARVGTAGLVSLHRAIGGDARAYALARGEVVVGPGMSEAARRLLPAAYPRPYADVVASTCAVFGVEPAHVYATMRQESGYDADARSRVGAIGLLQLMPATARRVAERIGLDAPIDPYDPPTNVRLGVGEMAELEARFDRQQPLVVAAYNAGVGRVTRWLPPGRRMATDLFVERIPYDETRGYVRRVLAHFAVYSALDGHPERALASLPPELVGH